jgi:hypothetical protein
MSSNLPRPVEKVVAAASGGFCGNPDCRAVIAHGDTFVGQIAHIAGEKPDSARYDARMTDNERNAAANLIALCPSCHTTVDKPGAATRYPVALLQSWKAEAARTLQRLAVSRIPELRRVQLENVVNGLLHGQFGPTAEDDPLALITPDEKMQMNQLGDDTKAAITAAMTRFREFERVLGHVNMLNPQATAELEKAVVGEYRELARVQEGDRLFRAMVDWCRQGDWRPDAQSAGIVVVSFFFERCDIFERV